MTPEQRAELLDSVQPKVTLLRDMSLTLQTDSMSLHNHSVTMQKESMVWDDWIARLNKAITEYQDSLFLSTPLVSTQIEAIPRSILIRHMTPEQRAELLDSAQKKVSCWESSMEPLQLVNARIQIKRAYIQAYRRLAENEKKDRDSLFWTTRLLASAASIYGATMLNNSAKLEKVVSDVNQAGEQLMETTVLLASAASIDGVTMLNNSAKLEKAAAALNQAREELQELQDLISSLGSSIDTEDGGSA